MARELLARARGATYERSKTGAEATNKNESYGIVSYMMLS